MTVQITESEIVPYKDFTMPPLVYKYRDWSHNSHKRIVTHREVYFSSPANFEDEFDCKNPTRWDLLTHEEILNKYYQDSWKLNPSFTIEQHQDFAIDWANHTMVTDKDYVDRQQSETFNQFNDRTGVLSLTEYPAEIRMWEKYSNSHTGFCIGFDAKTMLYKTGSGAGIVLYHDELPQIHPTPKHTTTEQILLQVFCKLDHWSFEKEYRVFKFKNTPLTKADRCVVINPYAFKEIIIGSSMSGDDAKKLIDSIPPEIRQIKIKKAHLINNEIIIRDF
ncbi:DUF2971 domain-containing protein [Mucilaginibacter ginsenosidivorax]|uniref:DUF2971 domain-containing protein n=1 Tax=Mucilaginibacter ginsenosidivorax TaxID=862126 RepID=A0A5B8W975_9SPHI|nr:DUF2971 domain-containing protein [Mucilaginibacter ginsenosidivorax]QEC79452.1 DUF2971 domain-containing protein [Mucilaginibacter ginsenosidivorax]